MPEPTFGVVIYGASDDLIEIDGEAAGCDEYNTDDATFKLTGTDGAVTVMRVVYDEQHSRGCWMIAVGPEDEDVPMVPVSIMHGHPRSEWDPNVGGSLDVRGAHGYTAVALCEVVKVELLGQDES